MLSVTAPIHARLDSVLDPDKLTGTVRGLIYERLAVFLSIISLGASIQLVFVSYVEYGTAPSRYSIAGVALYLVGIIAFLVWNRIMETTNQTHKWRNKATGWVLIMFIGIGFLSVSSLIAPFMS
jgi:hypothetical protein